MDDRIGAEAIAAARQLLQSYKAEHLIGTGPEHGQATVPAPAINREATEDKTPIDELVKWYGLEVTTFDPDYHPPGTYGWLEPGEDLIWLCQGLPETLRRFTLAHELGHAVLHRRTASQQLPPAEPVREDHCLGIDVQEETIGPVGLAWAEEILGIGQAYDPRSQRELAANIFAAELLMPLERVHTLYLAQRTPASRLASMFGVSSAAMLNRLAGLLTEPISMDEHPVGAGVTVGTGGGGLVPVLGAETPESQDEVPVRHYDKFQQAAIEAATPALIVAGPGSGKTSTLIGRTEYLVRTLAVDPQHILALTFSRKAAQEMRERLQLTLHSTVNRALQVPSQLSVDTLPAVSTFHAFCAEMLRTCGERVGLRPDFTLVDDAEGYFLLRSLADELPLRHYQHLRMPTYYFPDILQAISRAKDELVTPEQYEYLAQRMLEQATDDEEVQKAEKALEVAAIYARYQAGLQQRGDTDFGGLIMLTVQLLQQHADVLDEQQQRYQHILVDEFQDMNRASGVLLRLLAGEERRVWVVGDANQAIYSFRGASPANIANFEYDYPGATVLPLSRNYRSRPDIVSLADVFRYERLEAGACGGGQTARPAHAEAYVTLAKAEDESGELVGMAADMRYKQEQLGCAYGDMVVLCRTRALARKVSSALAGAGLPVIDRGDGSLLEQEHILDLLSILLLLAEPGGMGVLRAARQREHAMTQSDIEALLLEARKQGIPAGSLIAHGEAPASMSVAGRRALTRLTEIVQTLRRMPGAWSMLAHYLFIETSIARDLLRGQPRGSHLDVQSRRVLADYASLLQIARYYDQRQQREEQQGGERDGKQGLAKGFLDYLNVIATLRQDGGFRRQGTEDESGDQANGIRVMTVHASKGLEFPVVYLPGLVQRRFPMQARFSPITALAGMLTMGGTEVEDIHESGEACLFYVGITRARDQLVLSYSERYGKQNYKASPYLDALVTGLPAGRLKQVYWSGELAAAGEGRNGREGIAVPSGQPSVDFVEAVEAKTLSVSAIETYAICPRRYAYGNIYGFRHEESGYQLFWQATQKTLEALQLSQAEAGRTDSTKTEDVRFPGRQEARDLFTQHWRATGGHEMPFASIYEQHGHEVIEKLCLMLAEGKHAQWELRKGFEVQVAGRTIRIEVDRVEASSQKGESARFVRARVGKRKEKSTPEVRELLYAHAYRQQYPGKSIQVLHHNLSTGEMLSIKLSEKREQRLREELAHVIRGLEQHTYPATPDSFVCPTCPFFMICPA